VTRIVCIGNSLIPGDAAGSHVYERLLRAGLPHGVELVEGGLAGLNLLPFFDDGRRVVLVDTVSGLAASGDVELFDCAPALGRTDGAYYGHGGGLSCLFGVLPAVADGPLPEILLVGMERPAGESAVQTAADMCLDLAWGGRSLEPRPLS